MRDARPLPGRTPAEVLSQLAHRTFGPVRIDRVRATLDYHGLAGREAQPQVDVATRHGITDPTLRAWRQTLAAAGSRQPLSAELASAIARRSRPDDDHLGRTRIASTFGLVPPEGPPRTSPMSLDAKPSPVGKAPARAPSHAGSAARIACRVLVAVGPLTVPTLVQSVLRSRWYRDHRAISPRDLAAALDRLGAFVDEHGCWHAPPGWKALERDQLIVSKAIGRELTRRDLSAVLVTAGYSAVSASGRSVDTHPLLRKVAGDRYTLVSEDLKFGDSTAEEKDKSPTQM